MHSSCALFTHARNENLLPWPLWMMMTQPTSPSPNLSLMLPTPSTAIASVQCAGCASHEIEKPLDTLREWTRTDVSCICCLCSFSWTNFENGSFFLYYSYNLYETIFQSFNRCMWSGRPAAASEVRPGARYQSCNVAFASRRGSPVSVCSIVNRVVTFVTQLKVVFLYFLCWHFKHAAHTQKHTHTHTLATLINIERLHSTTFDTWVRARRRRRGGEVICPVPRTWVHLRLQAAVVELPH